MNQIEEALTEYEATAIDDAQEACAETISVARKFRSANPAPAKTAQEACRALDGAGDVRTKTNSSKTEQPAPAPLPSSVDPFIRELERRGIRLWLDGPLLRYRAVNTLTAELKAQIAIHKPAIVAHLASHGNGDIGAIAPDPEARFQPFPLTDLQEAYCAGETNLHPLSTPALVYYEFDVPSIDIDRLDSVLWQLVQRHDMLRVRLLADGQQICLPAEEARTRPGYADLQSLSSNERQARIEAKRPGAGNGLSALSEGQPFDCFVHRLPDGYRVHLTLRLFCVDAHSITILLNELVRSYYGQCYQAHEPAVQFRDYVAHLVRERQSANYTRDLEYWRVRAAKLYPVPQLPLAPGIALPRESRFNQLQYRLSPPLWRDFRKWALKHHLSPSAALCTVYAEVLSRWSGSRPFSLTTLVGRRPSGPEWQEVIGNFASTVILQVDIEMDPSFADRVKRLQTVLHESLEHAAVSAVEVLRIRRLALNDSSQQAIPVVFASSLENEPSETGPRAFEAAGWNLTARKLHTPQVWLDHQVWSDGGTLFCNWDFVDGLFPDGMIHDMFATFCRNLEDLASNASAWTNRDQWELPGEHLASRIIANATQRALPATGFLGGDFMAVCDANARRPALVTSNETLTYSDLEQLTRRLAGALHSNGIREGELVAIYVGKGWQQIVAAVSIIRAGNAYLPIDRSLPHDRAKLLLAQSGARTILVDDSDVPHVQAPGLTTYNINELLEVEDQSPLKEAEADPESLAYVIYTSGSTGIPKGVAIPHRAAANTIRDILQRFGFTDKDRVLGLSSLSFDLSVFDIFGSFSCGASLVLPPSGVSPDPAAWAKCIEETGVTVWNSVPGLLEMMLEYLGDRGPSIVGRLRLVMLSGDWIPLDLVRRLRSINPSLLIVGLGGATEAGIWSNYFILDRLREEWASVPYGVPLSNQKMHILDSLLRSSPTWVANELYISGKGLAKGYYRDAARTGASFIHHPVTKERLYRTGDYARYWPDGNIEFLGRRDNQVKIGGFRIELGEIEARLHSCEGVRQVVCAVRGASSAERRLVAFVVPMSGEKLDPEKLRAHAVSELPAYMVPRSIVLVDAIPLTANGKVDRNRLLEVNEAVEVAPKQTVAAGDHVENQLAELWRDLCGRSVQSYDANFFLMGGTSLLAVRLVAAIREQFGIEIPLGSLFANATFRDQAAFIREERRTKSNADVRNAFSPIVHIRDGSIPLILIHPVGGNILCYRELVESIPPGIGVIGVQAVATDGPAVATLPDIAAEYAEELLRLSLGRQPHIAGWSMGGIVALELARQLAASGSLPASVTLIDSYQRAPKATEDFDKFTALRGFFADFLNGASLPDGFCETDKAPNEAQLAAGLPCLIESGHISQHVRATELIAAFRMYKRNYQALLGYEPSRCSSETLMLSATRKSTFAGLKQIAAEQIGARQVLVDADHYSMVRGRAAKMVAKHIASLILSRESPSDIYNEGQQIGAKV